MTAITEQLHPAVLSYLKTQPKRMLIDGEWVEAASGKTFETINPATGEALGRVAEADREDIDRAVRAARKAFHGDWSKVKPSGRQALLFRLADLVEANRDELGILEVLDNGMPITVARDGLLPRVAELLRYYGGWATKIHGETIDTSVPGDFCTYTLREPVGVVGAIVPWNSPLVTAMWKLGPALGGGVHRGAETGRTNAPDVPSPGRADPGGWISSRSREYLSGIWSDGGSGPGRAQ